MAKDEIKVTNVKATSASGMACPRCGGPVAVGSNPVFMQFGLIGALLHLLLKSYECPACGKIKFAEFPAEVRAEQRRSTLLAVLVGVLLLAVLIGAIVFFATK